MAKTTFSGVAHASCAALLTLMGLTGCHDGVQGNFPAGNGGIAPAVDLNKSVESSRDNSRATQVTVNDLSLTISSTDGSFSRTWASVADYAQDTEFAIGQYKVEASYGDVDNEGFDRPAYYGSTTVQVVENKVATVALTASLANSMVTVEYSDEFKSYMSSWSAEVHTAASNYLYYGPEETNPLYIKPGNTTLDVDFTKPNGKSAKLRVASFVARARYHYTINVGLDTKTGEAHLTVTFDENLSNEDVDIDLSDALLDAPAPVMTGNGVTHEGTVEHNEGSQAADAKVNIMARGGIREVTLVTRSKTLNAQGWPAEIDLVSANESMQSRLKGLGLDVKGLWKDKDKLAVVDFTMVPAHFREADGLDASEFDLLVVDTYGKVSEHFAFAMTMKPIQLSLSNPSALAIGANSLEVDLAYNGTDAGKDVTMQYKTDLGVWENIAITAVKDNGDGTYRLSLTVPATANALTLRAVAKQKASNTLVVERSAIPAYTVSVAEARVWARKATVTVASEQADAAVLARASTVFVSADGVNFTRANIVSVKGCDIAIDGLAPGTAYTVKVSLNGNADANAASTRFATEAAAGVPNGDFENTTTRYSGTKLNQTGLWSISAGTNYQSYVDYDIKEADGWATVNAKTMSGANKNTFFTQPAAFSTDVKWSSTVPKIKVIGTGGGTETPAAFTGFSAHSGSAAMVVRNVGWDPNGTTPSVWKKEFASTSDYYNHTEPAVTKAAVGKLFLGTYAYDSASGTETYDSGVDFASRPQSLKGWYTYTPDAGDTADNGTVTVEVLNGNTVIGRGTASLGAASQYKEFTVALTYVDYAPKATRVRVMITSSRHASDTSIASETNLLKLTTYLSRYEAYRHGATLMVDDLSFQY